MQKKNTRAQECPFVLQERGDKRKIKQPRLQRGSGEASALPWLLFPAGLQQDFADGGRSLFQTQVPQTTAWLKTSTAASPPRCVSGSDSTERLCRDCFPEVRGLGRFRCCLSRQGQGLRTEQSLVGTSDPGMEQQRGVRARWEMLFHGSMVLPGWDLTHFSWRRNLSCRHPPPTPSVCTAPTPAGPDVAQILWKRETLSTFWLGAGLKNPNKQDLLCCGDNGCVSTARLGDEGFPAPAGMGSQCRKEGPGKTRPC